MKSMILVLGALASVHAGAILRREAPITAAPAATKIEARAASVTSVSSCVNAADPDSGIGANCQCSGYTGLLPTMSGGGCDYTTVPASFSTPAATTSSGGPGAFVDFPCTSTRSADDAVLAYKTFSVYNGITVCSGSSTTATSGISFTMTMDTKVSVAVGTLTGAPLGASIMTALSAACPSITASDQTVTSCGAAATITGIAWAEADDTQANVVDMSDSGELLVTVATVNYTTEAGRDALIGLVANMVNSSAALASNAYPAGSKDEAGDAAKTTVYNAAGLLQSQWWEAGLRDNEQSMWVTLTNKDEGGKFSCGDIATMNDAFAAAIAFIPGLDVLAGVLAISGAAISIACSAVDSASGD